MTRRCSHCSNNGHNSRTCPARCGGASGSGGGGGGISGGGGGGSGNGGGIGCGGGGVKLFGVRLTDGSIIKKSASMGNLSLAAHHHSSSSAAAAAASPNHPGSPNSDHNNNTTSNPMIHVSDGYVSDDPTAHASSSTNHHRGERKKGIAWTEEEHRMFLLGLQKIGKGDWRGIARNYVVSRTPTQVASHAQKYFIRHNNSTRRKRRSSLFDMVVDKAMDTSPVPEEQPLAPSPQPQEIEIDNTISVPSLDLSLEPMETTSYKPMESTSYKPPEALEELVESFSYVPPLQVPTFYPVYVPVTFPIWPTTFTHAEEVEEEEKVETSHHQVLKPIPIIPKQSVNVDELVGMSRLNLEEAKQLKKSDSALSLRLLETSRQSAFHANTPASGPDTKEGKTYAIQAVLIRNQSDNPV